MRGRHAAAPTQPFSKYQEGQDIARVLDRAPGGAGSPQAVAGKPGEPRPRSSGAPRCRGSERALPFHTKAPGRAWQVPRHRQLGTAGGDLSPDEPQHSHTRQAICKPRCTSLVSGLAPHGPTDGSSLLTGRQQRSNYPIFKARSHICMSQRSLSLCSEDTRGQQDVPGRLRGSLSGCSRRCLAFSETPRP